MTLSKSLENTANLAIVLLALILVGLLLRSYFVAAAPPEFVSIGDKVTQPELNFSASEHNIMVFLRYDCHFCQESRDFYERLIQETTPIPSTHVTAVFEEDKPDNKDFLKGMSPSFENVRILPFANLKIDATPTIIDVNSLGSVQGVWRGKLTPEKEKQFFAAIK